MKMTLSIYLVLLIILFVFNVVFWTLIVWLRIFFDCETCSCIRRDDDEEDATDDLSAGHGNPAFLDDDDPPRPYAIFESMESPPSYEEAIKYDRFGFDVAAFQGTQTSTETLSATNLQNAASASLARCEPMPHAVPDTRPRSSGSASQLTPITEEEDGVTPVTVVIDSIGVQASRVMPDVERNVNILEGDALQKSSNC